MGIAFDKMANKAFTNKSLLVGYTYQGFVAKITRKYSLRLHGALSSLKKCKHFLLVWVVFT